MNKMLALENKIKNSNKKITKNFLYYLIAPIVVLIAGIILLCTVGFNGGLEFNGGSTFTIYINNGGEYSEPAEQYDINEDFHAICDKIEDVLIEADGRLSVASFQKTKMSIEGKVANGDAIKVVFLNSTSDKDKIEQENEALKLRLIYAFAYDEDAVSSVDYQEPTFSLSNFLIALSSIVLAISVASIYMAFRNKNASFLMGIVQVAIDLVLVLGLMAILRIPVDNNISAILLACGAMSFANFFAFYGHSKTNIKEGLYENMKNCEKADATVKALAVRKGIIYAVLTVLAIICVCLPVAGVRNIALGILMSIITTFYTTNFITPALWSISYRERKVKKA